MSPYFAQGTATSVVFSVTVGVWALLETRQRLVGRAGADRADRGSYLAVVLALAAGWGATAAASTHGVARFAGQPAVFIAGAVLAWAGIVLRVWSFRTLGGYFTFVVRTSADQRVVDTGPYRLLRHPGYSAIELVLLGMALMYGTWLGLAAMALLPPIGLVYRIRVEERALRAALGTAYDDFAATRRRMVPGVW